MPESAPIDPPRFRDRPVSFVRRSGRMSDGQERAWAELAPRYLLEFDLGDRRMLEARVALSTVDVAGARGNLATANGLAFDTARAQADSAWNSLLGRIEIEQVSTVTNSQRPMVGQAPYMFNTGLTWTSNSGASSATLLYNVVKKRFFG